MRIGVRERMRRLERGSAGERSDDARQIARLGSGGGLDDRLDFLAPVVVRNAEDRHVAYFGM